MLRHMQLLSLIIKLLPPHNCLQPWSLRSHAGQCQQHFHWQLLLHRLLLPAVAHPWPPSAGHSAPPVQPLVVAAAMVVLVSAAVAVAALLAGPAWLKCEGFFCIVAAYCMSQRASFDTRLTLIQRCSQAQPDGSFEAVRVDRLHKQGRVHVDQGLKDALLPY